MGDEGHTPVTIEQAREELSQGQIDEFKGASFKF